MSELSPKYFAFISYSHRDKAIASRMHSALEHYRVPRRLVGRIGRDGAVPRRIVPIFRDLDELPTSSNLALRSTKPSRPRAI